MFWMLMRKEMRLQRSTLGAALFIAAIIYGIVWPILTLSARDAATGPFAMAPFYLRPAARFALGASTLLVAVCAGVAAPTERRERWADWLAILPVARASVVGARLTAALVTFGLIVGVHLLIELVAHVWTQSIVIDYGGHTERWLLAWQASRASVWTSPSISPLLGGNASAAMGLFGVAWLIGSFTRSGPAAVGTPILLLLVSFAPLVQLRYDDERDAFIHSLMTVSLIAGICGLIAGTVIALRRVEP